MIDLHCHILPGIDDGAQTIEDSIKMAKKAVDDGITHILCTPHHNGKYYNPKAKVIHAVGELQQELDKRQIPLTLFEGQEVRIQGELLQAIDNDEILFADLANTYLLIELPTSEIPGYTERLLYGLLDRNHIPIIVHPECNLGFQKDVNQLVHFLDMGVLAQMTAPSIVGVYGKKTQKIAKQMLDHKMVQMIASDAHALEMRDFYLKEAYQFIETEHGASRVEEMKQVAKDVLNGDRVLARGYSLLETKKWFFGKK